VQLANEERLEAEDACEAARALAADVEGVRGRCAAAEATVSTLLLRLRAADDEKAALQARSVSEMQDLEERFQRQTDELVHARTELATARFELDEANLQSRKSRQLHACSKEREASLAADLAQERLKTADLALRLEEALRMGKRMGAELSRLKLLAAQGPPGERRALATVQFNAA
jgi:hypothetical protein